MPEQMPSYLRIDKDIKQGLINLQKLQREYSQFDVLKLERDIHRKLEIALDRQSTEFKFNRRASQLKLEGAVKILEVCILAKEEIIQIRLEKQCDTVATVELTRQFQAREAADAIKLRE